MTRHDDAVYLRHMLEHAREAITLLGDLSTAQLREARVLQLALLHLVEIVGETATRVSRPTRDTLPNIPWRGMVNMRNKIIHGYDTVKVEVLWDTIVNDLPPLVKLIEESLESEKE